MRVTEGTNYRNLLADIARGKERLQSAQMQISSGKRVSSPSDDPSAASDIVRLSSEKSETAQYQRNLSFARSKLEFTDTVLDSVERVAERVRTLAQLAVSDNADSSMYRAEVDGLRDQLISSANATHAGRFIFGGSVTTEAPFAKAGDSTVSYQGNDEEMTVQAGRARTLETQIPGSEIFNGPVDIFETMSDLSAAMQSQDKDAIHALTLRIEQFAETVSVSRTRIGNYINNVTNLESEMTSARLARESDLTEAQAADLAEAITAFQMSENALQATMTIGARISQLNLMDYL
jgi:flagellar hook-associated protein 3 FlgL